MGIQPPDGISLEESREIARLHFIVDAAERLSDRPYDLMLQGQAYKPGSDELVDFQRWLPLWSAAEQSFQSGELQDLKKANPHPSTLSQKDSAMIWLRFTLLLPTPQTVQPILEVKNLKEWEGQEGMGFTLDLWIDRKKACFIRNDAHGGSFHYDWLDRELEKVFDNYVKNLPVSFDNEYQISPFGSAYNTDMAIAVLVDDIAEQKELMRMTKKGTQTCFRLIGDKLDTWRVIDHPLDDKIRAWIHKQHPGQEVTFLNDRLKVESLRKHRLAPNQPKPKKHRS